MRLDSRSSRGQSGTPATVASGPDDLLDDVQRDCLESQVEEVEDSDSDPCVL